jgi:peptidoglycan/LPS O-acetylase OafA/YrhL
MVLYLVGQFSGRPGKVWATVVLLGKYSLFGYIAQIAILQALRVGLNHAGSKALVLGLSFVLAFALTVISVAIVDRAREKSTAVDKSYRAVFA